jgi:galacturan 1,4-alpha-galacturonidase
MNLQSGFKFLSCQLLRVQVQGKIIAPNTIEEWNNCQADYWIGFVGVANLNMYGSGLIDGQGSVWWMRAMQASSLNVIIYTYC